MLLPLVNYSCNYQIGKSPYEIFQFIESQQLVRSTTWFSMNPFNLVASLLGNDPLIMQFYLDKAFPSNRPSSRIVATLLRATFIGQNNHTLISINITPSWVPVFFYCSLLVGLLFELTRSTDIVTYIIGIMFFVTLDISGKIRVKKNFERLIRAAENE